jgi:hypothetical protein
MATTLELEDGGTVTRAWDGTSFRWEIFGLPIGLEHVLATEFVGVVIHLTSAERQMLIGMLTDVDTLPPEGGRS